VADAQRNKRYDHELVLPFFAFLRRSNEYRHEVGDFLTEFMEDASDPDGVDPSVFDPARDAEIFRKTFRVLRRAAESRPELGQRIFGSVDTGGRIRGQFAVYHYEGLTLGIQPLLGNLNPDDQTQMTRLGELVLQIKTSPALRAFTGGGKNTAPAYRQRIEHFATEFQKLV
jgi:hypothetical protein